MMINILLVIFAIFIVWPNNASAQDVVAGESAFRKCQICHDVGIAL